MTGLNPFRREFLDYLITEGVSFYDLARLHGFDSRTVRRYYPDYQAREHQARYLSRIDPEKFIQMGYLLDDEASVNEISRTLRVDHRTVKRYYSGAGWEHGSEEHKASVRLERQMREIEGKNYL